MAITRIKSNQITDGAVTTAKIADNNITAGKLANNLTYGSNLTVTGNLTVSGTTVSVSTTNTRVEDSIIALASEVSGSPSNDAGLLINRGSSDNYAFLWDESADQFVVANVTTEDGDTAGNVTIDSYANLQAGTITYATLNDGSNDITSTAAEINLIDGSSAGTIVNSKAVIYGSSGEVNATTLQIGGTSITATAAELNIMDGDTSVGTDAFAGGDGLVTNDAGTMKQTSVDTLDTYLSATTKTLTNKTINSDSNTLTLDLSEGTLTGTTAEFNTALSDDSFATLAGTETLSNKTLTAPKIADSGFIADANGNELIIFTTTASAVNEITLANAATSGHPTITTTGGDTNINLVLSPKGSGTVDVDTSKIVNVTDPTSNQDAATKAYVDTQVSAGSALTIAADSGSDDVVTVGSDTLTFAGTSNEIETTVTDNTITIGLPDDVTIGSDLTVTGNLTINGTTTTLSATNSVISDSLIELNNGAGSNSNDLGFIFERGSTGDNAAFVWDESADVFVLGTTTATGASTGNLTITKGALEVATINTTGTATLNDITVGGGYGSTGVTISAAGVIQANGAITTDGALTADSASIGGGYGDTGVSISSAGVIQANGAITSDGAVTGGSLTDGTATLSSGALSGATTGAFSSNVTVDGNIDISGGSGTITTNVADTHVLYSVSGVITGEAGFTYNATSNELTIPSATVSDLTSGRIVTAGTSGALQDSGTLLWDGTDLTAGSAIISDLTSGRVVLAGTSGAVEDSANLTFDGSTLAVTGAITASSNVDIADAGSLRIGTGNDFTINHDGTDTAITNGTGLLTIDGTATSAIRVNEAGANVDFVVEGDTNTALLTVDASQDNVGIGGAPNANAILDVNDTGAILLARGTTAQRPTGVTGMFRYNTTNNALEYYDNSGWSGISSDFTLATSQTFDGDNSTVAFTLSSLTGSDSYTVAGVLVMLNGVVQEPTTVYGISGTTLTFTTAPASGDKIEVRKFTTTTTVVAIADSDGDTQIQVEESSDEDIIRFDIGGSEKMVLNSTQLSVTGNIVATGDITANGDITLGDANTDTITLGAEIGSDIIPDTDGSRDLGSATNRFAEAHVDDILLGPQGDVRFYDSDSSNFVAFQAGATVASNITWTLPTADAAVSGYALVSDASGTLSWAAAGSTTTSDTTTNAEEQIYFGDITSGAVTAVHHDADLTYNPSLGRLTSGAFAGDLTGDVTGNVTGDVTGNADTATALSSAVTVSLTGDVTGSATFTSAGDTASIATTIQANSVALGTDTTGNYVQQGATSGNGISGSVNSEGGTFTVTSNATNANTASTIVFRDGSGNFSAGTITAALSGNATTATTLQTARTIGGVSFNGSANINLPGVNTAGNQNTTGNASTATTATNVTVSANNTANETVYITFVDGATGTQGIETDTNLTYNPSSNTLTTSVFSGTATTAQYADLAEKYDADEPIEPGTVVHFAGDGKVAECDTANCKSVAGVISTDPAYLMNSALDGGVELALTGRVPCKVTGVVNAGDLMVSAGNGRAMANNDAGIGTVIGKAIEANEGGDGVIEVLITMM